MAKYKLARTAGISHGQKSNEDDQDARTGPVDADLVDQIEISRAKDVDQGTHKHDCPEADDCVPWLNLVVFVEEVDGADDELGAAEIDGEGNGPVADEGKPAVDEAHGRCPSRW